MSGSCGGARGREGGGRGGGGGRVGRVAHTPCIAAPYQKKEKDGWHPRVPPQRPRCGCRRARRRRRRRAARAPAGSCAPPPTPLAQNVRPKNNIKRSPSGGVAHRRPQGWRRRRTWAQPTLGIPFVFSRTLSRRSLEYLRSSRCASGSVVQRTGINEKRIDVDL